MSCQDQCLIVDYDVCAEFVREETRRAAKPHKCCECQRVIAVGESHHYAAGKCDGEFWSIRTCAECTEVRDVFECEGWVAGMLWEMVSEQLFPRWNEMTAIDCLARLKTPAAVDAMRARYADYLEAQS